MGGDLSWQGDIAVLTLDYTRANAINRAFLRDMHANLAAALDEEAAGLVLTGSGRTFSSGLDLKETLHTSRAELAQFLHLFQHVLEELFTFPKPVIAAINGNAIAGGTVLALCSDYRIGATGEYQLGLTELKLGLPFPAVALSVVENQLGRQTLRRMLFGASLYQPHEALRLGLLDELISPEELLPRATAMASSMAEAGEAFATLKHQLRQPVMDALVDRSEINDQWVDHWLSTTTQSRVLALLLALEEGKEAAEAPRSARS